jgi:hypothetical protein
MKLKTLCSMILLGAFCQLFGWNISRVYNSVCHRHMVFSLAGCLNKDYACQYLSWLNCIHDARQNFSTIRNLQLLWHSRSASMWQIENEVNRRNEYFRRDCRRNGGEFVVRLSWPQNDAWQMKLLGAPIVLACVSGDFVRMNQHLWEHAEPLNR